MPRNNSVETYEGQRILVARDQHSGRPVKIKLVTPPPGQDGELPGTYLGRTRVNWDPSDLPAELPAWALGAMGTMPVLKIDGGGRVVLGVDCWWHETDGAGAIP